MSDTSSSDSGKYDTFLRLPEPLLNRGILSTDSDIQMPEGSPAGQAGGDDSDSDDSIVMPDGEAPPEARLAMPQCKFAFLGLFSRAKLIVDSTCSLLDDATDDASRSPDVCTYATWFRPSSILPWQQLPTTSTSFRDRFQSYATSPSWILS